MSNFFVPSHIRDVPYVKTLAGPQFASTDICCFGIEVCDRALALGARNVSFHEISWETLRQLSEVPNTAEALARSFDARHSELRARYLGLEVESLGWDYLNINWIAQSVLSLRSAFTPFLEKLPGDKIPVFLDTCNSQDYYFDSKLLRGILKKALSVKFKEIIVAEIPQWEIFKPTANNFTLDIPAGEFRVLCHLPTVFYSASGHMERLDSFGEGRVLDLESPYFDIPISPNRIKLGEGRFERNAERFSEYWREYERLIEDFYITIDLIEGARSSGMFERHRGWAISQYEAYKSLASAECLKEIERVEMSCHDTGLAGPLISWANQRGVPVHMWPHSEVINAVTPVLKRGQKHFHVEGSTLPLELGVGRSEWTGLKKRTDVPPVQGKTLLILMNQLDAPWYVPNCQILGLRKALQDFIQRMAEEGWHVKFRQKPSHAYNVLLGFENVENVTGPLETLSGWPAVCISVGSPTTAMIGFWEGGSQCYHIQERTVSLAERFIIPSNEVGVLHSDRFSYLFDAVFERVTGRARKTAEASDRE
jgi:hypothetical protein